MKATWKPHEEHAKLSSAERKEIPDTVGAFRKPQRAACRCFPCGGEFARFDQVKDVTDEERDLALANIQSAVRHYHIDMNEKNWRELGKSSNAKGSTSLQRQGFSCVAL